jgi:uracil-DNA glycosylase
MDRTQHSVPQRTAAPVYAPRTFAQWREAARELLAAGIAPGAVQWALPDALSGAPTLPPPPHNAVFQPNPRHPAPSLPRSLMELLYAAAGCRVPDRWAVLYRVVWRWQQGDHGPHNAADPDGARLHDMVAAVRREEHDMHANIRFRERAPEAGPPRFVAWYEPRHDVLPQVAEHFVSRMGQVSWMIATPEASMLWDGASLHDCGPLVGSPAELDDTGVAPWLAYYRSVYPQPATARGGVPQVPTHPGPASRIIPILAAGGKRGSMEGTGTGKPQEQQPATLDECRRCDLWQHATQPVGGAGSKRARIMLVGEQPGDQEDIAGAPFVGPAGKLLDRACEEAGVDRRTLYVTNAVKHFKWEPRGKRRMHKTPAQREIEACSYWLEKELAQIGPQVVVAMGTTALKSVLGTSHLTLKDTMGQALRHEGRWVVTIYHPSYVLRVPDDAAKKIAFGVMVDGLKLAHRLLDEPGDGRAP